MNKLDIANYNLELTLLGGQSFSWEKIEDTYLGTFLDNLIILFLENNELLWQTYPKKDNLNLVRNYLNIDFKYEDALQSIQKDDYIKAAVKDSNGVRILKQDFETVLLNFILSSHKSVKGVRKLVKDISKKYGKPFETEFGKVFSFPSAEVIAILSEKDLRDIGAGFRAPYLKLAAEKLVRDRNLIKELKVKTTGEIKDYLISFKGIGDKIADCILVFGLNRMDITPLDVWGKRILTDFYNLDSKLSYQQMSTWYSDYFGKHTAIAGQILFEYIRNLPNASRKRK